MGVDHQPAQAAGGQQRLYTQDELPAHPTMQGKPLFNWRLISTSIGHVHSLCRANRTAAPGAIRMPLLLSTT